MGLDVPVRRVRATAIALWREVSAREDADSEREVVQEPRLCAKRATGVRVSVVRQSAEGDVFTSERRMLMVDSVKSKKNSAQSSCCVRARCKNA